MMLSVLLSLALVGADPELSAGAELSFNGGVAPINEDRSVGATLKTFDLTLLLTHVDDARAAGAWLIAERGQGGWPWSERFGSAAYDAAWRPGESSPPSLLYRHDEGESILPLPTPFYIPPVEPRPGATWTDGPLEYEVVDSDRRAGRECWRIVARRNLGVARTLWLDRHSPLVVASEDRVFMNQGQSHELKLEFVGVKNQPAEQFAPTRDAFEALIALRQELNNPPQTPAPAWTDEQRAVLRERIPPLAAMIQTGPLAKIVAAAERDLEFQSTRAEAVGELGVEQLGRKAPKFDIAGLGLARLSDADLAGAVTVLHFWDYRDQPLKEPYGQVGYLEFFKRRRQPDGVQVFGVMVDGRLANDDGRRAAAASARKLRSFMNLSYPILLDAGQLIKKFGDPRVTGAELPLFVVIGRDGHVVHYHVGHDVVDPQSGLQALDRAVSAALRDDVE